MDKSEYLHLLSEASINDTTKFISVDPERLKTRGRPPKHYHPLIQKGERPGIYCSQNSTQTDCRFCAPHRLAASTPVWFTHDLVSSDLVSYDVSPLFTNVPLEETIQILADKAFINNWFNETHQLNLSRMDLVDLLRASTKDQLFQFNGQLYERNRSMA